MAKDNPVVLSCERVMFKDFRVKEAKGNYPASQEITMEFEDGGLRLNSSSYDFSKIQRLVPYRFSGEVRFRQGVKDGRSWFLTEVINAVVEVLDGKK